MKILISNKFYYPRGGDCIHTIALKKLLEDGGNQVSVFSMQHTNNLECSEQVYWPKEISYSKNNIYQLLTASLRPFGTNEVKQKWIAIIKDFNPDIIHLNNIHSQLSPVIARLAKKLNIPVVWTLHDYKLLCPAYTFRDSQGKICEDCLESPMSVIRKKCIKGSLLASCLGYLENKKWNRKILQEATNVFIAPSLFLKQKMEQGTYSPNSIIHLYNFTEDDKFKNEIITQRNNEVVFVGRLSSEKGVSTLCKAFQNIIYSKLTIIGDGPLRIELENQYKSDQIQFMGFQPWSVIQEKLSNAAFMIIPSEWYENNPLTMIESFALGTPVLGANIGGISELIEDGKNGMIFQSGNVENLSLMIEKMLGKSNWNYQYISTMAAKKFSSQNYYNELMKIYMKISSVKL